MKRTPYCSVILEPLIHLLSQTKFISAGPEIRRLPDLRAGPRRLRRPRPPPQVQPPEGRRQPRDRLRRLLRGDALGMVPHQVPPRVRRRHRGLRARRAVLRPLRRVRSRGDLRLQVRSRTHHFIHGFIKSRT